LTVRNIFNIIFIIGTKENIMDIEFRDAGGSRVGFIIGSDIKDSNGNRVGMIVGNDIKDSYGNRINLDGSDIKDSYGNRVGIIIGDDIKDVYGNRVGYAIGGASEMEKAAAGLLLFGLKPAVTTSSSSSSGSSDNSVNYSQYEDNAVKGDSSAQGVQGLVSLLFKESQLTPEQLKLEQEQWKRQQEEVLYWQIEKRREKEQQQKEAAEKREKEILEEKEAWKKKRLFYYGLGGIIGVFVFAVLPSLGEGAAIGVSFGVAVVLLFLMGSATNNYWIGLLSGIVVFFIPLFIGFLVMDGFPLPVAIPIGFILGALIVLIVKKSER
jgi:hypothetical protein